MIEGPSAAKSSKRYEVHETRSKLISTYSMSKKDIAVRAQRIEDFTKKYDFSAMFDSGELVYTPLPTGYLLYVIIQIDRSEVNFRELRQ